MHIYQNAEVQTQAPRQSSNYFAISPRLVSQRNCQKVRPERNRCKYQQGKFGYKHLDTVHLPSFKTIMDSDINHVKPALTENPTNTSTDLIHILAQKETRASKSTVKKSDRRSRIYCNCSEIWPNGEECQ